ncbi:hypothetical protein J6590_091801 [Homalodisca vitripennis]|nr:hypothetical protein J6590_091801 [Homalodisca vitripennis]
MRKHLEQFRPELLVEVVDSNEFRPEFSQAEFVVTVEESVRPGTSLVHATATDNDVTSQLIYSVHNSRSVTSLELFDLDHVTGLLTVAQSLDRESISEHILTVVVSDSSSPVKRNFARVIVHVTDNNDHAPQWSGGVVQAVVLENAFVGSRVVTVVATDRDHGANAAVTYAIVSGNVGNYFSIDPVMGDISVARDLDCEEAAEFNLIVRAVDQGSAPLASTLPVFVTVRQSDHAPPRFEEIRAVAEVEESVAVGWIVWQARARSALSLTYDIEDGNSDRHFTINPTTGVVSTQHPLDYETRPSYNLTVSATNMAGVRAEIGLVVDIVDYNGNSPRFPETEYQSRHYRKTKIGLVADIVDCNDNSLRFLETEYQSRHYRKTSYLYLVWNEEQNRAGSVSGLQRQLPRFPDRISRHYRKTMTAEIGLVVDIVDCNDNSPRFLGPNTKADTIGKQVIYISFTERSDAEIGLRPNTKADTIGKQVIYISFTERSDSRDRAGSRHSGLQRQLPSVSRDRIPKQTVDIVDYNDNSPRTPSQGLRSSRILGALVVKAEDATLLSSSTTSWSSREDLSHRSIQEQSAPKASWTWRGDPVQSQCPGPGHRLPNRPVGTSPSSLGSGITRRQRLSATTLPDRVAMRPPPTSTMSLRPGSPQLSGRDLATVWVQITDVNDCPPHFSQTEYNTTVLLPTFNNVSIAQVQASDCDSPNITKLEYSIVTGNYENVYAMSGDSGLISLKNKSRGIHKSPHRLKVAVSDGPHTAFAFVNIKWEWSSQSTLKFQQDVYEAAIVENSTKIVTVAVVSVVGAELNEHVVFSLLNPSPLFHIGPTSGAIQTTGLRFDREHQDHFQLIVQANKSCQWTVEVVVRGVVLAAEKPTRSGVYRDPDTNFSEKIWALHMGAN